MLVALTVTSKRPYRFIDGARAACRRVSRRVHMEERPLSEIIDGVLTTLAAPLWTSGDHQIER
jgi:hypothetical protein